MVGSGDGSGLAWGGVLDFFYVVVMLATPFVLARDARVLSTMKADLAAHCKAIHA